MELDKLTSPIKNEKIAKEREIENKDKKSKEAILNLKALYESYYYEKQRSIKNAYKLSIQTGQFSFSTFLIILFVSGLLVTFITSMFTMQVNVAANIFSVMPPFLFFAEILLLLILDYFVTALILKSMLSQPEIQKIVSEFILKEMINHGLITEDDLHVNGIDINIVDCGLGILKMNFTYNDDNSDITEKQLLIDSNTQ